MSAGPGWARHRLAGPNGPVRHASPLAVGDTFALDDAARRALDFREINVKEAFTVEDAAGTFFRASRKAPDNAVVYEKMAAPPESRAAITLVCAVLARQRMIFVVQKATELGVVRVVPVLTDKSVQPKDLDHEKPWAWPGQALKGAKQCRRAQVPFVEKASPLAKALDAPWWRGADARFVLDDRAEGASDPFALSADAPSVVLVVGPEGGFSDHERAELASRGAVSLAFGSRVLRAETAVLAGLTVVQHRLGDLR